MSPQPDPQDGPEWSEAYPTASKGLLLAAYDAPDGPCTGYFALRQGGTTTPIPINAGPTAVEVATVIGNQAYVMSHCGDATAARGLYRYDVATTQVTPVIGAGAWWGGTVRSFAIVDRHS